MSRAAMQQALEALETCSEDEVYNDSDFGMVQAYDEDKVTNAITALRAALAEPEQVSVAATHKHEWFRTGTMEPGQMRCIRCGVWGHETAPTPRKPVELTDEEIQRTYFSCRADYVDYARAVIAAYEAKQKEQEHE